MILLHLSDRCLYTFVFRKATHKAFFEFHMCGICLIPRVVIHNKAQSYKITPVSYGMGFTVQFL